MGVCMNQVSYVPCGCKALLSEKDHRAASWKAVFGCLEFPLKSPIATTGSGPGESPGRFLMGDWEALSMDKKSMLFHEMERIFPGINYGDFVAQNRTLGYIPIKDVNISVLVCQLHTRMMV